MRLFRRKDANRQNAAAQIVQDFQNAIYTSPLCSAYENMFAQLRPLIDELKTVTPYGVGRNGAKLPLTQTPEIRALLDPNESMGWSEFADAMFATWLTKSELNIWAHRSKTGRIEGYTLLNGVPAVELGDGTREWRTRSGVVSTSEVLTLTYSRNPDNLAQGVSPAMAVNVIAQIDDLLAQFQRGVFENGAIPATITTITASTPEKYNAARKELERGLKGANNAGKTLYIWNQLLPTGEQSKQVEITPIQSTNNQLAIHEIVEFVNDRLNKAVGVSNFILGDDSSAKYDNAELSDHQFTKRRVYPALVNFYNQFQHELDRITGGLGYAISFDLPLPELTERKHALALIAKDNAETLRDLILSGADALPACEALGLGKSWQLVAQGIANQHREDREMQASQAVTAPEPAKQETKTEEPTKPAQDAHTHAYCHHNDVYVPFTDKEKTERKIFDELITLAKAIFEEDPNQDIQTVIDRIVDLLDEEAEAGATEAVRVIEGLVDDPEIGAKLAEVLKQEKKLDDAFTKRLHDRTEELIKNYDTKTREIMRAVLSTSEGLTADEIAERLAEKMPDGNAATIARNEVNYAFKSGRLEMDKSAANEYGFDIDLIWHTSRDSDVCPLCAAMEGQVTHLGRAFTPQPVQDGAIMKTWGRTSWNDYGEIPNAHTNCRCYFDEKLIKRA